MYTKVRWIYPRLELLNFITLKSAYIQYICGSVLHTYDLARAQAACAEACFVFVNNEAMSNDSADKEAVVTAFALKEMAVGHTRARSYE